ncbi:MAG TPA: prepilin-type N-terminal cleavage/methylation domain-containing protein [Phycisphaerales bacterium]|nr:prepilin-type N-terminal cleavage/methylation domain-containing protein [Phycisphaerales bacterium]
MNIFTNQKDRQKSGFTIIELLVVVSILALLAALLLPALGKAMGAARTTKDKSQIGGIHGAMLLYASSNEGNLPLPSVIGSGHANVAHDYSDTTANLMSLMLGRNYFTTAILISPVETNSKISDINVDTLTYDYDSIDGDTILWDEAFKGDISAATLSSPANNSYAHQALWGERVRMKWNSGSSSSDIILSNRGPENGVQDSPAYTNSNTLKFHGSESVWIGTVVSGDGSVRTVQSVFPEGIAYQPLNGLPLGPDNLFNPDWGDVDPTDATKSGDNWLIICNLADETTGNINAVWD